MLKESPKYGINAAAVPLQGSLPVYIRITDISEDGYFSPSEKVGVNSPFSELYKLSAGDIVLARTGASVGKSYLYREQDGELVYAGFLIKVAPKSNLLNPEFLFQYLKTEQYWDWVTVNSMRSGQPGINGNEYGSLLVPLPEIREQTAIANALSDVDALLTELEKLIAKKQAIKTATMQQLLTGKTRLPRFATYTEGEKKGQPKGTKSSELGEIPEDWDVKELGSVCMLKSGLGITSKDIDSGSQFPCYGGNGLRGYTKTYTHEGDFALIGRQGALCGNIQFASGKFFASEHALVATPCKGNDAKWLAIYLERMHLNQYSESSAQPGLSAEKLRVLKIIAPTPEEQTAIASILTDMDTEVQTLEQRLAKTRQIKQGMMQELLTGRTRLPLNRE
jgi:type I restriction enzyme S subunit